ncbi:MAG: hypothetical protein EOM66_04950 [Clostridia bacterium]|nr:hypothetical protein [Candidatus Pelethousia sp.]NCB30737.1 hypothetical protein [Clostridia bacterium]
MIKGVDAQIMTQRAAEYSKDVSAMLRRDELANEFADRMSKLNAQQEAKTVSHLEKTEQALIRGDQEKGKEQQGQRRKRAKPAQGSQTAPESQSGMELPGVGEQPGNRLLDIEI